MLFLTVLAAASVALAAPTSHSAARHFYILPTSLESSTSPHLQQQNALAQPTFHGRYGTRHAAQYIYSSPSQLLSDDQLFKGYDEAEEGLIQVSFLSDNLDSTDVLVWVGRAGVEGVDEKTVAEALFHLGESFSDRVRLAHELSGGSLADSSQAAFSSNINSDEALLLQPGAWPFQSQLETPSFGLFQVAGALLPIIDKLLPPFLVPVVVPLQGYPQLKESVPKERAQYLQNITDHIKFSPKVDKLVQSLDVNSLKKDIAYLTGEDPSSPILSRHSFSSGAVLAATYIKETVEHTGANCTLVPFLVGFAPNVICEYDVVGNSQDRVVVSGHYDSRGSFGSTRAPGGDDDASGTGSVLAIARAIKRAGIKGFRNKVTLAFFAGEEQGLLGSNAYAKSLFEANETVLIQVQGDMLGYHDDGETMQLGFPDLIGTQEASNLLSRLSSIYSPELVVGTTNACCSDHQSFDAYGFAATQVFERNGGIIDPMYHNSGDLSRRANYDFDQIKSIGKVTFATLLEVGGFVL